MLGIPENIGDFDTLEIDVVMECPNTMAYGLGNCGAWDYLAHMWSGRSSEKRGARAKTRPRRAVIPETLVV